MNTRSSLRRSSTPPPDYSGVLFDNSDEVSAVQSDAGYETPASRDFNRQNRGDEKAQREKVTLPLPVPNMHNIIPQGGGYTSSPPRVRRRKIWDNLIPRKEPEQGTISAASADLLSGLLEKMGTDDLLLIVLIVMMLESGADFNTLLLLGFLLIF